MARADQIYIMRPLVGIDGVYQHHGIDYGDSNIIHYRKTGNQAIISRTSFETFSWGNPVYPATPPHPTPAPEPLDPSLINRWDNGFLWVALVALVLAGLTWFS